MASAIVDGALELYLGLDAEVPTEVPHRPAFSGISFFLLFTPTGALS